MSRYVVIGAGGVGAPVAAQLYLHDLPVVLVARGEHGAAIRDRGLRYLRADGELTVPLPVVAGPDELTLAPDDVLVLATKSQDTETVLQDWSWRPVPAAGRPAASVLALLSLQNGVENERAALRRFADVQGAAIWLPGTYLRPGEVVSPAKPAPGIFWLGRYPGAAGDDTDPGVEAIAADLRTAEFWVQVVPDVPRWKAGKLLANLANAIDALYGSGATADRVVEELQAEARRAFAAAGLTPADLYRESSIDLASFRFATVPGHGRGGGSTWQSMARAAGSVEVDFLNGEIVLLGRLHGVPVPLNEAIQERLAVAARDGVPPRSADPAELEALLAQSAGGGR